MAEQYYSGQGKLYTAKRDGSGNPTGFTYLGNCPAFSISPGLQAVRYATGTSTGGTPFSLNKSGDQPEADISLDNFQKENLQLILYGATTLAAGTTVTNEVIVAYLGKTSALANINLSSITSLRKSDLSITYVNGVDYTIDLKSGCISFPATGSAIIEAQSLRATYVYGAVEKIDSFLQASPYYWLRYNGIDTVNDSKPVVIDFYKTRILLNGGIDLISQEISNLPLKVKVFYDAQRIVNDSTSSGLFTIRRG